MHLVATASTEEFRLYATLHQLCKWLHILLNLSEREACGLNNMGNIASRGEEACPAFRLTWETSRIQGTKLVLFPISFLILISHRQSCSCFNQLNSDGCATMRVAAVGSFVILYHGLKCTEPQWSKIYCSLSAIRSGSTRYLPNALPTTPLHHRSSTRMQRTWTTDSIRS